MTCPRPVARPLCLVLAWACLFLSGPWLAGAEVTRSSFSIPGGDAALTLRQLSRQARESVVFPIDLVHGIQTQPIQGEFTAREAAERMTAGTELFVSQDPQTGALVIARRAPPEPEAAPSPPSPQRAPSPMKPRTALSALRAWLGLALASPSIATAAAGSALPTGTIQGRVFNPATGEYVRNAEVHLQGLGRMVHTDDQGAFRIGDVPVGTVNLQILYAGYQSATDTLNLSAGETVAREINIIPQAYGEKPADGIVKLQEFIVSTDREGNAKAIMEQRRSMNIINSVASDAFGDIVEGNVGEFLKNIPGVELDYQNGDIRGVRLRGMDTQYVGLTIDGVQLAAADGFTAFANTNNGAIAGESVRAAGFEQLSLNNVESIEVSKTLSADMDADSPAGRINLRSRRAFERKGRQISWQTRLALNSEEFHLKRTNGPGDGRHYKASPGASVEYSDVFLNGRLGLIYSLNDMRMLITAMNIESTINKTTTLTDARPVVYTQFNMMDQPQSIDRLSNSLTLDFKATPNLVFSLGATVNHYSNYSPAKHLTFFLAANNTGATGRSTILGADPLLAFETSNAAGAARYLSIPPQYFTKKTISVTLVPALEYRRGSLRIDCKGAFSGAKNTYDSLHGGAPYTAEVLQLANANFRFERPDRDSFDWTITQTSGPDAIDLANYVAPSRRIRDFMRLVRNVRSGAQVDLRYEANQRFLSLLRAGAKINENIYDISNVDRWYTYTGPGTWASFSSPVRSDMGTIGVRFIGLNGEPMRPPQPNLEAIGDAFRTHPEWFVQQTMPVADWYTFRVTNRRYFVEQVPSAYVMTSAAPFRRLRLQAGLRWEQTETKARLPDQLTRAEVVAAGFTVDGTGRANTIPGLEYQFYSRPRIWREGGYDNLFPSASARFGFTENLVAQAGYHRAISRPPVGVLAGAWTVNETTQLVQMGNPNLLPEYSDSYSARLSYYLQPVGNLAIGVFQNDISNLRITQDFTAEQMGYGGDPVYGTYEFRTVTNGDGSRRFRGLELEYIQHLTFLPGMLRGLNVSGSYVRNYANLRRPGLVPHRYTGALGFKYRNLNLRFSATHMAETPWTSTVLAFQPAKTTFDVSGGYQLSRRLGFFFVGRNITNEVEHINQWFDDSRNSWFLWRQRQYGAAWTFGLKGTL